MQRVLIVSLAVGGAVACSEPVRTEGVDLARLAAPGGSTFVLARIEDQTREPFAIFDHVCEGGVRLVQTFRDTLTLWQDGSARRAMVGEQLIDGVPQPGTRNHFIAKGRWGPWQPQNVQYYSNGQSIRLYLASEHPAGPNYDMPFRVVGPDTLINRAALGGWCAGPEAGTGPRGDSRHAEFVYVRR